MTITPLERMLAAAVVGSCATFAGVRLLHDDRAPATDLPPTTIDVPIWVDGERAGTCQLDVTVETVGDLICEDLKVPTSTISMEAP